MAQRNPLVGDIEGNAEAVVTAAREARNLLGAELVVFPELVLTGYPPEDLLLRPSLNSRVDDALARIGERIEYGLLGLNVGVISNAAAPFGGVKESGVGREGGAEGIAEYTTVQYMGMPSPWA